MIELLKNKDYPDYIRMAQQREWSNLDLAKLMTYYATGKDIRYEHLDIFHSEDRRICQLFNRVISTRRFQHKENKYLLFEVYQKASIDWALIPWIILYTIAQFGYYYEAIVLWIYFRDKCTEECGLKMSKDFPKMIEELSPRECNDILELLNDNNMAKEAAILLNTRKEFNIGYTDFDL